jgi:hypothetical protein
MNEATTSKTPPRPDHVSSWDDRIAAGISRAVTRRTVLSRGARVAAATAAAFSLSLPFARRADARQCRFTTGHWGKHCASTRSCGPSRCTFSDLYTRDVCHGSADPRCNYWTSSPYCWCSLSGCHNGKYGYFSCCDCWKYGNSGSCRSGHTKCICKGFDYVRNC